MSTSQLISGWDGSSFDFHPTLPRMLGAPLIGDQVVQVGEPCEKRLLAPLQTGPKETLLVNSKTYEKVVLHMTFEGAKSQGRSPVKPTRMALEIGSCCINQQSQKIVYLSAEISDCVGAA